MERYPDNDRYKEFIWNDELGNYEMMARPMVAMCSDDTYEHDSMYALKSGPNASWAWNNFFDHPDEWMYETTEEWRAAVKEVAAYSLPVYPHTVRGHEQPGTMEYIYPLDAKQDTVEYAAVSPREYYYINMFDEEIQQWTDKKFEKMTLSKSGDVWKALHRPQTVFGPDPAVYPTGCTGQTSMHSVTGLCEEIFGGTFNGFSRIGIVSRGPLAGNTNWKFDDSAPYAPYARYIRNAAARTSSGSTTTQSSTATTQSSAATARQGNSGISISTKHVSDDGTIKDGFT